MTIDFGTLEDVSVRQAWENEATRFTPWLAENLSRLGDALGVPLELDGTEVAVGRYAADILARNARTGSPVLIENQLEPGDHRHLGQILTYLTGLKAETVVWVAPSFNEEHLSAIRWLNEHTKDPFAFFAVRLRVVRIGGSPLAPLFEVLERPNGWDEEVERVAKANQEVSPVGQRRRAFWSAYIQRFPDAAADGTAGGGSSRWRLVPGTDLVVSQWLSGDSVGVFVRGGRGIDGPAAMVKLVPQQAVLEERLGVAIGKAQYPFNKHFLADPTDETQWPAMIDFVGRETARYVTVLQDVFGAKD